jgi:hypothetical protein
MAQNEPQKSEAAAPGKSEIMTGNEYNAIIGCGLNIDILPPRGKQDEFRYENEDLDVPTVIRDRRFLSLTSDTISKIQLG